MTDRIVGCLMKIRAHQAKEGASFMLSNEGSDQSRSLQTDSFIPRQEEVKKEREMGMWFSQIRCGGTSQFAI